MSATMVIEEPTENEIHQENNNFTTPTSNGKDSSSQHQPIIWSLRIFDEFAKIKNSMEKFPLPGNDVELKFPVSQTVPGAVSDSNGYGSRMTDLLISLSLKSDHNIHKLNGLVEKAVDELKKMVLENEPLWIYDEQKRTHVLNNEEYNKRFRELEMTLDNIIKVVAGTNMPADLPNPDLTSSCSMSSNAIATREIGAVSLPPHCIIEIMMDVRLWSFTFGNMLSRAIVLESLARGDPCTHDGVVQVMSVEYHGPSPLLPTRQSYFARHCKQLATNTWIIVDVPFEEIVPNPITSFKRRQSGCLIEGLEQNGSSKVTWIEHVECDHEVNVHPLLKPLAELRFMFGAKRWVQTLMRQCQHFEAITQRKLDHSVGEDVLLRLSDRMRRSFYGNLSGSSVHVWKPLPIREAQDVLVRTSELENDHDAVTLAVHVTFWLPHDHERVFEYLQDERNRPVWDMIACGYSIDGTFHLKNGRSTGRTVSITKMLDEERKTVTTTLLQESCYNPDESYIIYTPIATKQVSRVLDEQCNADELSTAPSGFIIHQGENEVGGSVVSALFQLFDRHSRLDFVPLETVHTVYGFVMNTLHAIRNSLSQLSSPPNPSANENISI